MSDHDLPPDDSERRDASKASDADSRSVRNESGDGHDPITQRLRRELDSFTATVRHDPPPLPASAMPTGARPPQRGRWMAAAAAAMIVVGAAGAMVWSANTDEGGRSATPTSVLSNNTALTTPSSVPADPDDKPTATVFVHDPQAVVDGVGLTIDGQLRVRGHCLVLEADDGSQVIPVWPEGTTWDAFGRVVYLGGETVLTIGTRVRYGVGYDNRVAGVGAVSERQRSALDQCAEQLGIDTDATGWSVSIPDDVDISLPPWNRSSNRLLMVPAERMAGTTLADPDDDTTVQTVATVLESPDHGPQMCSPTAESAPQTCTGIDVVGWDWSTVPHGERNGSQWGTYVVVGRYAESAAAGDRTTFTVTQPARRATDEDVLDLHLAAQPNLPAPCAATPDRRASSTSAPLDVRKVRDAVNPLGGIWFDETTGIYTIQMLVTGDAREAALDAIAAFYDGPVCIVNAPNVMADLLRWQRELDDTDLPITTTIDVMTNTLRVAIVGPDPALEARILRSQGSAVSFERFDRSALTETND